MTEYGIAACVMITFSVFIFQQQSSCSAKSMSRILKPNSMHEFFFVKQDYVFCVFVTNRYCFAVYCNAVLGELDRLIHWVRTESVDL